MNNYLRRAMQGIRCCALVAALAAPNLVQAANIVWVSFHSGDNAPSGAAAGVGFTQAPDAEYTQLLQSVGHTVTRYVTTAAPDVNFLNTFDLVIVSRSAPSGHYQTADSNALWHSITTPTMHLGGYVIRANRLGFTTGDSIPDTADTIRLNVKEPGHPIFEGVNLDGANNMVNPYARIVTFNNQVQRGISVNTSPVISGGTLLATVGTASDPAFDGMIIGEFPAGTVMGNASADITAGRRLVFLTGSREQGITSEGAGIFDLETDGARLFLNAVSYMTGTEVTEPPPRVTNLSPGPGTTGYFAPGGISFEVTSGDPGGIPSANISLSLNGTDVTSSLEISGTPQARVVSFKNLVPDTEYTAVITVRDAADRETSTTFTFDTHSPFALPAATAFPSNAAVSTEPGFIARVVQAHNLGPVLANSAQRAEAQLAGTLIDPATGEPYPNETFPGGNPDGTHNLEIINWNVDALGIGAEQGNFRAPEHPDELVPGVFIHNDNIAAEILTYLELAPGRYFMGVNSDDGFVVFSGVDFKDILIKDLGRFDGGRASADTIFQFDVTTAGLYPFRLLWYQGGGGGNVEWFTMNQETGEKILINDRSNPNAVRAWRNITAPRRPYITSIAPRQGATRVGLSPTVSFTIQDGGTQLQTGSVSVTFEGQSVPATVNKAGGVTTVSFTPSQELTPSTSYTVNLQYSDNGSPQNVRNINTSFTTLRKAVNPGQILWASITPPAQGFYGADEDPNLADQGFINLLQSAGHTVERFYPPTSQNTLLTAEELTRINSYDLVILGRALGSGGFQPPQGPQWNTEVTIPLICMSPYLVRTLEGDAARMGWFAGATLPDGVSTPLTAVNLSDPATAYLFSTVEMNGNTTAEPFDEPLDRNTSHIVEAPVAGGVTRATAQVGGQNVQVIADFPAGTSVRSGNDVLAGYRMYMSGGSREASGEPVPQAGKENLTFTGEEIFLSAVELAINEGVPPAGSGDGPQLAFTRQGNSVVLSWTAPGFRLESTASLPAASWQPVAGGATSPVTIPMDNSSRFFRLSRE